MPEDAGSEREATTWSPPASIGLLEAVRVPGAGCWSARVTVAHADGPAPAWAPQLFDHPTAAEAWLAARSAHALRPAVRDCTDGPEGLAYAAVLDDRGDEVLVSSPVRRAKAAGLAALLVAELRARAVRAR